MTEPAEILDWHSLGKQSQRELVEAALKEYDPFFFNSQFLMKRTNGEWADLQLTSARLWLKQMGLSSKAQDGQDISDIDEAIFRIQNDRSIAYAGPLAGYRAGPRTMNGYPILVTDSPKLLTPVKGEFPIIQRFLENLLGNDEHRQLEFFKGWTKVALDCLYSGKLRYGQAVVLAGPRKCGKSRLQEMITAMFGGRAAKPYQFMTGVTPFNRDLFGAEHQMIEDEAASSNFAARRKLAASLKQITATYTQYCHGKHMQPVSLSPFWRLTMSVNEEPENLQVLPPYEDSIQDKMILFKAHKKPMPMPTSTAEQMETFWNKVLEELPFFVYHLLNDWEIPADLTDDRYGIRHFHHPQVVSALVALSPEVRLLELIDLYFQVAPVHHPDGGVIADVGQGTSKNKHAPIILSAAELQSRLETEESTRRSASIIFHFSAACGTYLGQLWASHPERVQEHRCATGRAWRICPPGWQENDPKWMDKIRRQKERVAESSD